MTKGVHRLTVFSIAYGQTAEHAETLTKGLARLGPNFLATICPICKGFGECQQRYTAGCGSGSYTTVGGCDYCGATGPLQGNREAPDSVREQVLIAGQS